PHYLLRLAKRRSRLARDRRNRVDQRNQLRHVMTVGRRECRGQWNTVGIDDKVVLGAEFSPVHGAFPRFFPPCTARTEDESTITCEKSICSDARSLANSSSWSFCQTPAFCQSRRRHHN